MLPVRSEEGPASPLRFPMQLCVLFGANNKRPVEVRPAVEVESLRPALKVESQQIRVEMSLGRVRPGLESIPEGLTDDESANEHEKFPSYESLTKSNSNPDSGPDWSL
jgi:hypothetical protein